MNKIEIENVLIDKFQELKKIIDSVINNKKDKNYLQNYLTFQYFPFFEYTQSIIILYKEKKYNPALVLLRSLIEAHLYIIYYQTGDWKYKLATAAKEAFDIKLATVNGLINLIKKYPNLESSDENALKNIKNLNKHKAWAENRKDTIIKANTLNQNDKSLTLESVAHKCDQEKLLNVAPGHFEQMYNLEYRYTSPFVHLNLEGLQSLIKKDGEGNFGLMELERPEVILSESIDLCTTLSENLYLNGVVNGSPPALISEIKSLCSEYLKSK